MHPESRESNLLGRNLNLACRLVPSPVNVAVLVTLGGFLVGGGLDALTDETLALGADHGENVLEGTAPHHQAALDLGPLLLTKDTVGGAVDKEFGLQLGELALNKTGTDGVNNPHLDIGGGNAQSGGDGGVGERARGGGGGQRGEGEETHLGLQSIGGLSEDAARDGGERGGRDEGLVGVEGVRGEDLEQLEEGAVAGTQGLDGIGGSEGSEVEDSGATQGGSESTHSELAGLGLADIGSVDGLQGLDNVRLSELLITSGGRGLGDSDVQLAGVVGVQLPRGEPRGELRSKLGLESLKGESRSGLPNHGNNGQENVIPARVSGGQGVEDGGEDGDGERGTELRRGGDGLGKVGANAREENIGIGGLVNKVNQEVVRRGDLCIDVSFFPLP